MNQTSGQSFSARYFSCHVIHVTSIEDSAHYHFLTQFLVEAATLSVAGGIVGIVLGVGASFLVSRLANWQTVIGPGAVLLAVFFSALVGISFGYYPARKAAYLDPIEALRYE